MKPQLYNVGDKIKIVGVEDCEFGVDPDMRNMVGKIVTISSAEWDSGWGAWHYGIIEDYGNWWWDDTCFETAIVCRDLGEFESTDIDEMLDLVM